MISEETKKQALSLDKLIREQNYRGVRNVRLNLSIQGENFDEYVASVMFDTYDGVDYLNVKTSTKSFEEAMNMLFVELRQD